MAKKQQTSTLIVSCHCGAVRLKVARKPRQLTACNCSICHRYGALWAYYAQRSVRVMCAPGAIESYSWGDKTIDFQRCTRCGCITHYASIKRRPGGKVGVNARMFAPAVIAPIRTRHFDGASSWKYVD